ncbi:MAG: KamA family radical SAM protein, partial [Lachnospiraceae bacterium]|nr:KamA family radical SAM protein [Lachnospiraceae bacterium]
LRRGAEIVSMANKMQNGFGKTADYTMSHPSGKIRILGCGEDGKLVFQYKQAKNPDLIGKIFSLDPGDEAWLPEKLPL